MDRRVSGITSKSLPVSLFPKEGIGVRKVEGDFFVPFKKACPEVAKKGIEGKFSVATIV
jgi:hypothetical protein